MSELLTFVISRCEIAGQAAQSDADAPRDRLKPGLAATNTKSMTSFLRSRCWESSVVRALPAHPKCRSSQASRGELEFWTISQCAI